MKKVVSATLAGALAVGMVPAMALADDAIELQASDAEVINQGEITAFAGTLPEGNVFAFGADISAIKPLAVTDGGAAAAEHDVTAYAWAKYDPKSTAKDSGDWTIDGKQFDLVGGFSANNAPLPADPGNYVIAAKVDGAWCFEVVPFTILPQAVSSDLAIYEVATSDLGKGIIDTDLVYDGTDFTFGSSKIALVSNGVQIVESAKVDFVNTYDAVTNLVRTDAKAAGEYYLLVDFDGVYVKVPYTVKKLNVADAKIELNKEIFVKGTDKSASISKINDGTSLNSFFAIEKISTNLEAPELGTHQVTVSLNDAGKKNTNIEGTSQVVDIVVVESKVDPVLAYVDVAKLTTEYATDDDKGTIGAYGVDYVVDRSAATYKASDEIVASQFAVTLGTQSFTDYDLVVTKWNGVKWVAADIADLTGGSYGYYNVKAVLDAKALGYKLAGETAEMTIQVINGTIGSADVAWANSTDTNITAVEYGTESVATAAGIVYTGRDFLSDLTVSVKANGKAVAAADYSIVAKKHNAKSTLTDKWEVCDAIVDAGQYKVEVVSSKYVVNNAVIYVDVTPVPVRSVPGDQIDAQGSKYTGFEFIYTGEAINPISAFHKLDGVGGSRVQVDGEYVPVEVPASGYKVTITAFKPEGAKDFVLKKDLPTEFKAAGYYEYTLADTDTATVSDNWLVETRNDKVTITAKNVFADVPADAWYADEVLAVAQANIMGGYGNGLFGPNDGMKRGDVALALGRALGMNTTMAFTGTGTTNTIVKVVTGFEDVDGGAYYARAIKSMADAGIMTGYADGTYGPDELITREQLATILSRIEESGLGDASILASALDAYADADEISKYAVAGVEWAVENGIMGVNTAYLNPGDVVTRAEVAAMLVRFDAKFDAFAAL